MERKLTAILAADVVGYSRLMEIDEAGTLAALKSHRHDLIDPKIAEHHGRVVKLMGDGALIEFASVVDAIICALDIQEGMIRRNETVPEERRIAFRVGVHLGDVMVDGDDIYGDGVNVASRLEGLAKSGGICISQQAFDQVETKLDLAFEDLGEQRVKNIARPVRAYRVQLDGAAPPNKKTASGFHLSALQMIGSAAAIMIVGAGLLFGWWELWAQNEGASPIEHLAFPLPDKPSIAVLPFTNMSDDPAQEYFSDGITEDLITDISKVSGLFVVASTSTFRYKNKAIDIRQVGDELGVRFVLEGSVRRAGDQVRINAQLIDAETGGHVWADRYDGSLQDMFGLQDQVTNRIVATLAVQLTIDEEARIAHRETENTDAYDFFLKGWEEYQRQTPESFRQAIAHFEKAVELDAGYSRAFAALSATYWQVWRRYWNSELGLLGSHESRYMAERFLAKAMENPTPLAIQVSAAMLSQWGKHDQAIVEAERAIALDPNDPEGYVALASAQNLAGRPADALRNIEQAMRLNPHYPPAYLYELGVARFGMEDFRGAADALEKATALNPDERWSLRLLIAAYGHLGRLDAAATVMRKVESNWGGFDPLSVRGVAYWYPFRKPEDAARLADGLRRAGVPD